MTTVAISLPKALLEAVEGQFGERYASRSEMFREILREYLERKGDE